MGGGVGKFVVLALLFGVVEAGLDLGESVSLGDSGSTHEAHSHLGSDDGSPDSDDGKTAHYCHCSTHAPALSFVVEGLSTVSGHAGPALVTNSYHSVTFPPPVPPPTS